MSISTGAANSKTRWTMLGTLRASAAVAQLLTGSAWSFLVQASSKASVLFTTLIAARALGVEQFGLYVSLQAIALLSVSLWDLGATPMLSRDLAAGIETPWTMPRRAAAARLWLLPLWAGVLAGGFLVVGVRTSSLAVTATIFGLAAFASGLSLVLTGLLNAGLRFKAAAQATASGRLSFALATGVTALLRPGDVLVAMSLAFLFGEAVTLAMLARAVKSERAETAVPRATASTSAAAGSCRPHAVFMTIRRSLPYAFSGFFILVYNRLDVVIVSIVAGAATAGLYAPASRIQDALLIFPMTAVAALTPVAARQFGVDRDRASVRQSFLFSLGLSLLLTVPATILALVVAEPLVAHALGGDFAGTVAPVRILALSLPFIAVGAPAMAVLTATGRASSVTAALAVGLVVAVAGLVLAAPRWGAEGAAWASMLREPIIAVCGLLMLSQHVPFRTLQGNSPS